MKRIHKYRCEGDGNAVSGETSPADFEVFQEEAVYWMQRFGLLGWRASFEHEVLECGTLAQCEFEAQNRWAVLTLNKEWGEEADEARVRECAFHETCELFLGRLRDLAEERFIRDGEVDGAIHEVIRTLENTLWRVEAYQDAPGGPEGEEGDTTPGGAGQTHKRGVVGFSLAIPRQAQKRG